MRFYNSHATDATPFGARWRSRWHNSLAVNGDKVTVTRADGREDTFTKSAGVFTSDPDVRSVLRQIPATGTPTSYAVTTPWDAVETYSLSGQLLSITERTGLMTTLAYNPSGDLTTVTGPFGHVLRFAYALGTDATRHIVSMTAPDGGVYRYGYDAAGNLRSVTYPDAKVRRYVYENADYPNFLTGIIDEKGIRYATWSYDNRGRAISSQHAGGVDRTTVSYATNASTVTDARGNASTYALVRQFGMVKPIGLTGAPLPAAGGKAFSYDESGFLSSRTDFDGNVTTYAHDALGNQTSRTEAAGTAQERTISTTWHATFHLPTKITEPNRATTFDYDAKGNLLSRTITAGAATRKFSYTYNSFGQALTATDPRGNVTTYTYDAEGNVASIKNALGHVTSFTNYDGAGRLLRAVDPNGLVTTLTYDARGRLTSRAEGALTTRYDYDAVGNLIKVTLPDASYLSFTYDAAHRLTKITDALGNYTAYMLDAAGNRIKEQTFDPANVLKRTRSYAYDAVNRLSQIINAGGVHKSNLAYDDQGNLTSVADPLGHATSYSYDPLNRLAQSLDPNSGRTTLGYDANDHLTLVTDPRGLKTGYAWTGLDNQALTVSPDTGETEKSFDAAGNVLTSTDARGKKTTFSYDALNRRKGMIFADGTSVVYQYDQGTNGVGRLTKVADPTGSTSYTYDANGHVTQKTQFTGGTTFTTRYGYDTGGRLSRVTYPSGKLVIYGYDTAGRVTRITAGVQTLVSGIVYQPFGGATGWTFGNGTAYARTFDLNGRVTALALPANDNIALTYDPAGRISQITDSALATKTFGYDALDRLTSYAGGSLAQSYTYDADGNRTNATLTIGAVSTALTYAIAPISNRLASISGGASERFTYDAAGNLLGHAPVNYQFAYGARGRMLAVTLGALRTNYGVNGLGQRVSKADPANASSKTHFVYDEAGRLIGEYDATGAVVQETVWLGELPIATVRPSGTFYIAPDHLGAPHQITNAVKRIVWFWDHDPFGNGAPTGSLTYNLRFPGQYYDAETGLFYNYFRDYDPKLGRYVQSDPIGLEGGPNTYGYAMGNPVIYIDNNGLIRKDTIIGAGKVMYGTFSFVVGAATIAAGTSAEVAFPIIGGIVGVPAQVFGAARMASGAFNIKHGYDQFNISLKDESIVNSNTLLPDGSFYVDSSLNKENINACSR